MSQLLALTGGTLLLFFSFLLLVSEKYRSHSNRFLAGSSIVLALLILRINEVSNGTLIQEVFTFIRIEYLFASLLHLYVFSTLRSPIGRDTYLFLFSPFVLLTGFNIAALITDWFGNLMLDKFIELIEPFEIYAIAIFNMSITVVFLLKVYRSPGRTSFKKWIYAIASGLIVILISMLLSEFIEIWFDTDIWNYFGVIIALFSMRLVYVGVQQLHVENEREIIKRIQKQDRKKTTFKTNSVRTSRFEKINFLMNEEKPFKNENFDREVLASKLDLSASSITRILKEEGQTNFTDFVNSYRVNLAREMLDDKRFDIFSLEAIGKEVGFKSRSTFYQTFKKEMSMTPGDYKKNR